jgi:AraC-like DNA-binding protein
MIEYLRVAYHVGQYVFGAGAIGTSVRWLYERLKQSLEDRVLLTFHNTDGPWQSASGVVGEMYLKAALNDAPGFFPPKLTGWRAFKHWLGVSPYRLRHAFRRAFILPSKERADKVLRELWKRGLLIRADWDHTDHEFYKLKN